MSVYLTSDVWIKVGMRPSEKMVMLALADRADCNCLVRYASTAVIANQTGVGRAGVRRFMRRWRRENILEPIEVSAKGQKIRVERIDLPRLIKLYPLTPLATLKA